MQKLEWRLGKVGTPPFCRTGVEFFKYNRGINDCVRKSFETFWNSLWQTLLVGLTFNLGPGVEYQSHRAIYEFFPLLEITFGTSSELARKFGNYSEIAMSVPKWKRTDVLLESGLEIKCRCSRSSISKLCTGQWPHDGQINPLKNGFYKCWSLTQQRTNITLLKFAWSVTKWQQSRFSSEQTQGAKTRDIFSLYVKYKLRTHASTEASLRSTFHFLHRWARRGRRARSQVSSCSSHSTPSPRRSPPGGRWGWLGAGGTSPLERKSGRDYQTASTQNQPRFWFNDWVQLWSRR